MLRWLRYMPTRAPLANCGEAFMGLRAFWASQSSFGYPPFDFMFLVLQTLSRSHRIDVDWHACRYLSLASPLPTIARQWLRALDGGATDPIRPYGGPPRGCTEIACH